VGQGGSSCWGSVPHGPVPVPRKWDTGPVGGRTIEPALAVLSVPVRDDVPSLFDIDHPAQAPDVLAPLPIKPEQIQAIRDAFEHAGIDSQGDRKALIESVVVREVSSLSQLQAVETRRILQRIEGLQAPKPRSSGSAWDDREEDTWIDKL
jgi:hypothetical protein